MRRWGFLLGKMKTDRLCSKFSVIAYAISASLFVVSIIIAGAMIKKVSVVLYFTGIIFQMIQLFIDIYFGKRTYITKEDAEEIITWIKEYPE